MKTYLLSIFKYLMIIVLLASCGNKKPNKQRISLSGAFALYPMTIVWSEEYKKTNPDVRFDIQAGGAGKGMTDALTRTVDLGMFSREITQTEKDQGVWWIAVTKDAVLPTINADNPLINLIKQKGLTRDQFKGIFIDGTINTWNGITGTSDSSKINVYTRSDACGAAATWAAYLGGHQENLKGVGVFGDPGLADAVVQDISGIGFNNTIYIYDVETGKKRPGLEVIPIDINGNNNLDADESFYDDFGSVLKAIGEGKYPSPPARELYFVSAGKPQDKATLDFLKWILTDGQQYVKKAGYVPLDKNTIEDQLKKLD